MEPNVADKNNTVNYHTFLGDRRYMNEVVTNRSPIRYLRITY